MLNKKVFSTIAVATVMGASLLSVTPVSAAMPALKFGAWNASLTGYGSTDLYPVPADYDGDGKADISVKTNGGNWLIDYASNGVGKWDESRMGYGSSDLYPVPADYDGDNKADISVKTNGGNWLIDYASNGFGKWDESRMGYGSSDLVPVPADYDGDDKADLSVKTNGGNWLIDLKSNNFGKWDYSLMGYGSTDLVPVPADYDGDGKTDISLKTNGGNWLIDYASVGAMVAHSIYDGHIKLSYDPSSMTVDSNNPAILRLNTTNSILHINAWGGGIATGNVNCSYEKVTLNNGTVLVKVPDSAQNKLYYHEVEADSSTPCGRYYTSFHGSVTNGAATAYGAYIDSPISNGAAFDEVIKTMTFH